jgi:uncharacterized protein (TIGR02246 family)
VRRAYVEAYNAGDANGIGELFTPECISMPPTNETIVGNAAVAAIYAQEFALFQGNLNVDTTESAEMGDWAYGLGSWSVTLTPKAGGEALKLQGKYLNLLKRQEDGGWKIARHIYNTPTPIELPPR